MSDLEFVFTGSQIIAYITLNANAGSLTLQNCHSGLKKDVIRKSFCQLFHI